MNTTLLRYGPWAPSKPIALRLGCRSYFTGRPCKRGHIAPRKTTGAVCLDCKKAASLTPEARARTAERAARWQADPAKASAVKAKQVRYNAAHRGERNRKKREAREFERFMQRLVSTEVDMKNVNSTDDEPLAGSTTYESCEASRVDGSQAATGSQP